MQIEELSLADLVPRLDARLVDDKAVAKMAESLDELGQLQPIRVRRKGPFYEVTFGWHRVNAHKLAGRKTILCQVVEECDEQAEKAMLDENLVRKELGRGDLEHYLARRKALYEKEHPKTAKGPAQAAVLNDTVSDIRSPTFSKAMEGQLGIHHDTVQRMAKRGANLSPEALDVIRPTPLMDDQRFLDELAAIPQAEQRAFAEQAVSGERPKAPKASAIDTVWSGLSEARRREFVGRHRHDLIILLGDVA